ncbi:Magnetosome protein MamI [Candidatus Terasakiella magnetica]|uniref:Magnetosome protein MamI n=1 Tax=Candidatus Terasakiella magnetica TaxID=1867952 RepID=A0A1C3RFV9_9PROT|nr:magnetosome protein MamI [Candidatus Terasakiella magnetica]SCA56094.1 Magnetosome protein MamI [Candidatus Terasakiella magnetica]
MPVVIFGLVAISLGLWGMAAWWWSVTELMRGLMPIILVTLGIVAVAAGLSKVRDDQSIKDEDLLDGEG